MNSTPYLYIDEAVAQNFRLDVDTNGSLTFWIYISERHKNKKLWKNAKFSKGDKIIDKYGHIAEIKHVWKNDYIVIIYNPLYSIYMEEKWSIEDVDRLYGKLDGLAGALYG